MKRNHIIRLCALVVGLSSIVWLSIQDIRTFLVEDRGIEYFRSNPIMILVCLVIGTVVGLTAHFILEWRNRKKQELGRSPEIEGA